MLIWIQVVLTETRCSPPLPLGQYVLTRKNNELGWEWPITKINEVVHPVSACLTVLRYSHSCQSAPRDLGCLSLHPSASLWLLEMEIKAVSCWFKKCHSFLPLKCFNNMKSLNLLLKMMMDILEQRFWGSLNFSNVHKNRHLESWVR